MKCIYLVTIDVPADLCIDPSSDADAIQSAVWEAFPHLPKDAILVGCAVPGARFSRLDGEQRVGESGVPPTPQDLED